MAFPKNIKGMLRKYSVLTQSRITADGFPCQGAKFHSPTPLEVHRVLVDHKSIFLCGTCRDNLRLFAEMFEVTGGKVEWPVRREFGWGIRKLIRERTTDG